MRQALFLILSCGIWPSFYPKQFAGKYLKCFGKKIRIPEGTRIFLPSTPYIKFFRSSYSLRLESSFTHYQLINTRYNALLIPSLRLRHAIGHAPSCRVLILLGASCSHYIYVHFPYSLFSLSLICCYS